MKILFKYATRGRPKWFKQTLNKYYSKMSNKHPYEFIITMDVDDSTMNNISMKSFLDSKPNLKYSYGIHDNKILAINDDMDDVDFDILVVVSDDMEPKIDDYDDIIVSKMKTFFPDTDGALHFNDGKCGRDRTITLSIIGKKLYDKFGYIYHPDYKSFYCDNEFTDVVYKMNKAKYFPQVIIHHNWRGFNGKDDIYAANSKLGENDDKIYVKRKKLNFPKESVL